jgi:hypothetical protein
MSQIQVYAAGGSGAVKSGGAANGQWPVATPADSAVLQRPEVSDKASNCLNLFISREAWPAWQL